ncbi:MAG: Dabb family protein [Microbacteriaceae bacterium]
MTIRHVVSWKLAEEDEQIRTEQVARIRAGLLALPAVIPEIRSMTVGSNVVPGNWDLVLIADYDDEDAMRRYAQHPEHQKVATLVRSVVSQRSAVDFTL